MGACRRRAGCAFLLGAQAASGPTRARASSLLIGAAWLPWVAVFWPGSVDWDSWGQISQVLGKQEMTAHHTVLSTWLHGWLFLAGRALGSDNLGVFFYIVLQFVVCAWVFGQAAAFAAKLGCSRRVQYAVTAFFALNPLWGAFIQTQVKDTLYTGVFVLFVLKTAELLVFPQEHKGRTKWLCAYALLGVLCCLLRKNGIYAVVPMLLAAALTLTEKSLRRPVLTVLLAVCVGSAGFDVFTEKVLDIPAGSVGEALSVPMQQTARYVVEYGGEVTDAEKAAISAAMDYDVLASGYMPELSDGVKQYYKNPGKRDLANYLLTWGEMFLKHPVCYLEATHANSHGYYTITKCREIDDYYTFNNDICMQMFEMDVRYLDKSGYLRYAFVQALSAFEKLPLAGLLTSIGFMAWLTAVLGLWLARCKAKPTLPILLGIGIFWLTCVASPVNDCMRYFLPVAGCLPLIFCLALHFSPKNAEKTA